MSVILNPTSFVIEPELCYVITVLVMIGLLRAGPKRVLDLTARSEPTPSFIAYDSDICSVRSKISAVLFFNV